MQVVFVISIGVSKHFEKIICFVGLKEICYLANTMFARYIFIFFFLVPRFREICTDNLENSFICISLTETNIESPSTCFVIHHSLFFYSSLNRFDLL